MSSVASACSNLEHPLLHVTHEPFLITKTPPSAAGKTCSSVNSDSGFSFKEKMQWPIRSHNDWRSLPDHFVDPSHQGFVMLNDVGWFPLGRILQRLARKPHAAICEQHPVMNGVAAAKRKVATSSILLRQHLH